MVTAVTTFYFIYCQHQSFANRPHTSILTGFPNIHRLGEQDIESTKDVNNIIIQVLSATLRRSSLHQVRGRPMPRLLIQCLHSRTLLLQRLSVLLLTWPAHYHFSLLLRWAIWMKSMSFTSPSDLFVQNSILQTNFEYSFGYWRLWLVACSWTGLCPEVG